MNLMHRDHFDLSAVFHFTSFTPLSAETDERVTQHYRPDFFSVLSSQSALTYKVTADKSSEERSALTSLFPLSRFFFIMGKNEKISYLHSLLFGLS